MGLRIGEPKVAKMANHMILPNEARYIRCPKGTDDWRHLNLFEPPHEAPAIYAPSCQRNFLSSIQFPFPSKLRSLSSTHNMKKLLLAGL